jgi:hypothetical protein
MDLALLDEKAMALDKGKKKKSGFSKKKKDKDKDKDAQQPLYLWFSLAITQLGLFFDIEYEFNFSPDLIVIIYVCCVHSCRRRPPVIPLELPKFTPRQSSPSQSQGLSSTTSNVPMARPKFGVALPGMNPGSNL